MKNLITTFLFCFHLVFGSETVPSNSLRKQEFMEGLKELDWEALENDIVELMTNSQDFFPADFGHYGPFFVRMAWHCAGTYRQVDGEGGCSGGRQRFEPERSWSDNTNLDKARILLEPIKLKYGAGLSWGDLMAFTGTVALKDMGTPTLGFCAGRMDDLTGEDSDILGPGALQDAVSPCPVDGECESPLGAQLLEHIYVNPNGFLGNPDPAASIDSIRDVFGRMGMNDSETVALIGGGHTFGKMHGGCNGSAGAPPREDPENPWPFPGACGGSNPSDVWTSGFEGTWSVAPLNWTQFFFRAVLEIDFELESSESGNNQFRPVGDSVLGPSADASREDVLSVSDRSQGIRVLATDLALIEDDSYRSTVELFAADFEEQGRQFSAAWYKLMTRDVGPASRCFGPDVPPAQPFQSPLPEPFESFDVNVATSAYKDLVKVGDNLEFDLMEAAFLCASTFRASDYFGGCNGGRIRLEPERSWPERAPLQDLLESVQQNTPSDVSFADMLVFSATSTLQKLSPGTPLTFCPLRSDALNEFQENSNSLQLFQYESKIIQQQRNMRLLGLSPLEFVALQLRPRSQEYVQALGYSGTIFSELSNAAASVLLTTQWRENGVEGIFGNELQNEDGTLFITRTDFALTLDDVFRSALLELGSSEDIFNDVFAKAWTKLMNSDRFSGPIENLCENGEIGLIQLSSNGDGGNTGNDEGSDGFFNEDNIAVLLLAGTVIVLLVVVVILVGCNKNRKAMKKGEAQVMVAKNNAY